MGWSWYKAHEIINSNWPQAGLLASFSSPLAQAPRRLPQLLSNSTFLVADCFPAGWIYWCYKLLWSCVDIQIDEVRWQKYKWNLWNVLLYLHSHEEDAPRETMTWAPVLHRACVVTIFDFLWPKLNIYEAWEIPSNFRSFCVRRVGSGDFCVRIFFSKKCSMFNPKRTSSTVKCLRNYIWWTFFCRD